MGAKKRQDKTHTKTMVEGKSEGDERLFASRKPREKDNPECTNAEKTDERAQLIFSAPNRHTQRRHSYLAWEA